MNDYEHRCFWEGTLLTTEQIILTITEVYEKMPVTDNKLILMPDKYYKVKFD